MVHVAFELMYSFAQYPILENSSPQKRSVLEILGKFAIEKIIEHYA
jgi:hypothetical protein